MSIILEKWDEILQVFKTEYDISNVAFNTWIKPLEVYEVNGNEVTIIVRDKLTLNHIENRYKFYLQTASVTVFSSQISRHMVRRADTAIS